ncbi:MAG: ferrochelatase [Candidatus Tokpelaia sp. JSC085]|nr:MAG: ferrochelatase [Candidatus Tokpelaia sp. JSC085]
MERPLLKKERIGVMLINLGTPCGISRRDLRCYLAEFLSDRRVIEWPILFWYPILYGIVLNTRPKKLRKAYARIWNDETNESPLRTYTRLQAEKLHRILDNADIDVRWAMRYGQPSVKTVTNALIACGCRRLVILSLYPQYSATTTAAVNDSVFNVLKKTRVIPAIRMVSSYADDSVYIDSLTSSVRKHLAILDFTPEVILASYHGIPKNYAKRGDPYLRECERTTVALRHKLGMDKEQMTMTFQSRFMFTEWLEPYTDRTIEQLARNGIQSIAVLNPGFASECLETLDEIVNKAAGIFHKNGGKNFTHIPCLNDSEEGMHVIEHLVRRELFGWV